MQLDGVGIKGQETLVMVLSRNNFPCTSMCYTQGYTYLTLLHGLWKVDIASRRKALTQVEQGEGLCGVNPYRESKVIYASQSSHQVHIYDPIQNKSQVLCGSGRNGFKDGTSSSSEFKQPFDMCTKSKSIFLSDPS